MVGEEDARTGTEGFHPALGIVEGWIEGLEKERLAGEPEDFSSFARDPLGITLENQGVCGKCRLDLGESANAGEQREGRIRTPCSAELFETLALEDEAIPCADGLGFRKHPSNDFGVSRERRFEVDEKHAGAAFQDGSESVFEMRNGQTRITGESNSLELDCRKAFDVSSEPFLGCRGVPGIQRVIMKQKERSIGRDAQIDLDERKIALHRTADGEQAVSRSMTGIPAVCRDKMEASPRGLKCGQGSLVWSPRASRCSRTAKPLTARFWRIDGNGMRRASKWRERKRQDTSKSEHGEGGGGVVHGGIRCHSPGHGKCEEWQRGFCVS